MERRAALKHISLAFGSVVATPTLLSILSSCTNDTLPKPYVFLKPFQIKILDALIPFLLPEADFPKVTTMQLTKFIDEMLYHTASNKDQELFTLGSNAFNSICNESLDNKNTNKLHELFKTYFLKTSKDEASIFTLLDKEQHQIPKHKIPDYLIYHFLTKSRYYMLLGYCTTRFYKEEIMT